MRKLLAVTALVCAIVTWMLVRSIPTQAQTESICETHYASVEIVMLEELPGHIESILVRCSEPAFIEPLPGGRVLVVAYIPFLE